MSSNVVPFRAPEGADDQSPDSALREWRMHDHWTPQNRPITDPVAQQGVMRQFFRVWHPHLSAAERNLLGFILDQTTNWGKRERHFTHRQIEEGNGYTGGAGIKRSHSKATLKSLEAKGFIRVDRSKPMFGALIEPNLEWEPPVQRVANSPARRRQRPSAHPDPASLEQTMQRAFERVYGRNAVWKPWTENQRSMAAGVLLKLWPMATADEIHRFFDWLVSYWHGLGDFYSMPPDPEIDFFIENARVLILEFMNMRSETRSEN